MQLGTGCIEETAHAVSEPLGGEVHPQAAVGISDVLEDVDTIGPELLPHVREGLRQQRWSRRGARHAEIGRRVGGLGRALGCVHIPQLSAALKSR